MNLANELREEIEYDPETGLFRWRRLFSNRKAGWFAGAKIQCGYLQIRFWGRTQYAHVLAWLHVYGEWPERLDHINRNKADNRIGNLRLATRSQNRINSEVRWDSTTNVTGVWHHPVQGYWMAHLRVGGVMFCKCFATKEEAVTHRAALELEHFGEYARLTGQP